MREELSLAPDEAFLLSVRRIAWEMTCCLCRRALCRCWGRSAREGMVDDHDGLISALDTDAFRHAVTTLIDDPRRRGKMATTARQTAQRRSAGTATERTDALYAGLLGTCHHEETPGEASGK